MKINKLSFTNINSLKGSHTIEFDQQPLSDAGIFAIVGATGAGKSTILDVITLALYNKVPRFGAVSKNDIEKLGSIITYATNAASASVTYTVKGVTYRSSWSIQRNRNNNWNDYHMELVNVTDLESIFPINKSDVPNSNAQIIGLDFNQFVKSILLSQGDFDQFLKSNAKDRAELIEKITGTTIYRTLGVKAFEKSKLYLEQVKFLQLQLTQTKVLSDEEIEAINISKQIIEADLIKISLEIEECHRNETLLTKAIQLTNRIDDNKTSLDLINETIKDFGSNELKIARHESISPLRSDISEYSRLNKEIHKQNLELEHLHKQAIKLREARDLILSELKPLLKVNDDTTDILASISSIDIEYNALRTTLNELREAGTKLRKKITELQNGTQNSYAKGILTIADPTVALESISKWIGEYKDNLTQQKLDNTTINELISLEVSIMNEVNKETHERQLIENVKKKIEAYNQNERDNLINLSELRQLSNEAVNFETLFIDKSKFLQSLINNKDLKLGEIRNGLVEGQNCPVCGSLVEDLSNLPALELGHLVIEIDVIELELNKLKESIDTSNEKLSGIKSKCLSIEAFNKSIKEDVEKHGFEIHSYSEMDNLIASSNEKIREKGKKLLEIREIKDLKINLDVLISAKSLFEELSQILQDYMAYEKTFKEIYKGIDVTSLMVKFRINYTNINNEILKNSTLLTNLQATHITNNEELITLSNNLSIALLSLDIESIDFAISLLLDEAEYQKLKKQKESLTEKLNNLNTLIFNDQFEFDQLKEALVKIETSDVLELRRLIGLKNDEKGQFLIEIGKIVQKLNADNTAQLSRIQIQQELGSFQKAGRKWELLKSVIGDAKGSLFSSFAQNLTLNHLVRLANHRLSNFTDRYLIHTPTQDRDLEIIDTYQSNAIRAVKTLSGGETFLISLAMALSLSDLASRNINLECLFIDEGFGTLDNETLDLALDSLESLKNDSGKTIGIISHVEPLKERIATQIVLVKDGQGFSTLNIVPKLK